MGPMGVGVLYGKENGLMLCAFLSGGEMIDVVTPEKVTYNILPYNLKQARHMCLGR